MNHPKAARNPASYDGFRESIYIVNLHAFLLSFFRQILSMRRCSCSAVIRLDIASIVVVGLEQN